jgi:multiple sugar transport system permease protein/fructooligosaccharide transport system permease protein
MKPLAGWTISIVVAVGFLLPLIWMVHATFLSERAIFQPGLGERIRSPHSADNYADAWRRGDVGTGLANSLIQVGGIVLGGLVVNAMAAYAFARLDFPGRNLLFYAVVVLIILPVEVLAIPLYLTVRDLGLLGGRTPAQTRLLALTALILPFMAKAFNIYFLRQHFLSLPVALEEAAVVDGAGPFGVFFRVALPAIRPALATVVVIDVLFHWGQFLWPLMISNEAESRTIQLSLANLFTRPPIQWGDIMACAVIATIPVVLIFAVLQRYVVSTQFGSGTK